MIFWEKSQFVDFMSSLFCSYGSGVVNKSYSKIKFTVRYVVPLCGFFVHFFWYIHYSQSYGASNTKGWHLEKWVRASLTRQLRKPLFPNSGFQHSWFSSSTNPKAPDWIEKREHMADVVECPSSSLLQNHGEQILGIYILVDVTVLEWHSLDSWLCGRWKYIAWHSMGITKVGKSETETGWPPNVLR